MSRLPSLVRPLSRTAPLSRSLPSLAVVGGRRVPSWSNLQQLVRSGHAAQAARAGRAPRWSNLQQLARSGHAAQAARAGRARRLLFGLSEVRDARVVTGMPIHESTPMARFAGFDDLDNTRFSGFSTPLSSSRFSGCSMPGSETYGSMPRLAGPGSSVQLASGESLSSMPTLSRAGSTGTSSRAGLDDMAADLWYQNRLVNIRMAPSTDTRLTSKYTGSEPYFSARSPSTGTLSSMGSERYFSDLGARPRSVSSVRSAPPIAERASLASSDISY